MKKIIFVILALFCSGFGQTKTLDRKYVPILIKGSQIPRVNLLIQEWKAYRFQADQNSWTLVPFQVDEVDSEGKYNKEKDGIIDTNDELLIMPEDLGDRAAVGDWLNDAGTRKEQRIELAFIDAQTIDKKGWLYLYRNVSSDQVPIGFHSYVSAPTGTAADTAKTFSYTIGHNRDGWIDFVSFPVAPKKNMVDRLKLRFAGETMTAGLGKYVCSEDTLNNGSSSYHPGLVRAFHDQRTLFTIPKLWPKPINADYQLEYYPYSFRIGVSGIKVDPLLLALAGLKSIRQSLDLSAQAAGGKFYSPSNLEGVAIDGSTDNVATAISQTSGAQWLLASGPWGTVLMILELPQINKSITKVYYRDDQAGGTADGSSDTGDKASYGDMGLWVYTLASALVTDRINIDFNCYFINEPDHDAQFAQEIFAWDQNTPTLEYREQTFVATRVGQEFSTPDKFSLMPGYPNPFNPEQSVWQAQLQAPGWNADFEAVVYNLLGQRIAVLTAASGVTKTIEIRWNGRDLSGLLAPAGLYFLRVQVDNRSFLQRIVVTR
jgi:hypothetical protein